MLLQENIMRVLKLLECFDTIEGKERIYDMKAMILPPLSRIIHTRREERGVK